jgi:purine-binding chemotaxis protein CheW
MNLAKIRQKTKSVRPENSAGSLLNTEELPAVSFLPISAFQPLPPAVASAGLSDECVAEPLFLQPAPNIPPVSMRQPYKGSRRTGEFDPVKAILDGREAAGCCYVIRAEYSDIPEAENSDVMEFLSVRISDEIYGIDIMKIKEIIKLREFTEIPRSPAFLPGIISLRGLIIPVIDMSVRLGLLQLERAGGERIIVVKNDDGFFGLQVDEVVQVVKIQKNSFEPAPQVLDAINREFVCGIGRCNGVMIIMLNIEKIIDINLC